MAFNPAGSQTGTDLNLENVTAVDGVSVITTGSGLNAFKNYTWDDASILNVSGSLTINPVKECLNMSDSVGINSVNVVNGGTLNLGVELTSNGNTIYSTGTALRVPRLLVACCNNGMLTLRSGATLNWKGATIQGASVWDWQAGCAVDIKDGKFINTRGSLIRIRNSCSNLTVDGLEIEGGASIDFFRAPLSFKGFNPKNGDRAAELISTGAGGTDSIYLFEGYDSQGMNYDFSIWSGAHGKFKNSVKGTALDCVAGPTNITNSIAEIAQDVAFSFSDSAGIPVEDVTVYISDYDNGERVARSPRSGVDLEFTAIAPLVLSSDATGHCSGEVQTGYKIPSATIRRQSGYNYMSTQTFYRSKNNDSTDEYDMGFASYHHLLASPPTQSLKQAGVLGIDWTLFADTLVTEQDYTVALAYSEQATAFKAYDKGKATLVTPANYRGEQQTYIGRVGDTLSLGSKDLIIGQAEVFSQSTTTVTLAGATFADNIMTSGAVVLEALASGKTIKSSSGVTFTTYPTALTVDGAVINVSGSVDVSTWIFLNSGTLKLIADATVITGGKLVTIDENGFTLMLNDSVSKRFFGMPTGLPHTATPILLEELANNGDPLSPRVYLEPFSDSATGEVTVSLKPNTKYDWKGDALGYERSNGDTFRRIDTATHVGDIEVSLTQILYPAGGAIYGNGNPAHLALMTLDVATVQARLGAIPAGEKVSFETGVDFIEIQLTNHDAMKLGLRQPSLNPTAKEIIWPDNSPLTISDLTSNTRVVEVAFISKKIDGTLTLASPFNSAYGVRMPETIITATGGDVNLVSVNGVEVSSIDEFKAKADIYTGKFVSLSNSDPNRASGTVYGVNGTTASPCDNIEDALAIALENNLDIHVLDSQWAPATLPNAFLGVSWRGEGLGTVVSFPADSGIVTRGASLQNLTVSFSSEWYTVGNTQGLEFRNVNISEDLISGIGTARGLGQFKLYDCIMRGVECLNFYAVGTRFNNSSLSVRGDLAINGGGGTIFVSRGNPSSSPADIANFSGAIVIVGGSAGPINILGGSGSILLLNGVTSRVTVTGRARDSLTDNSGGSATVIFVDERGTSSTPTIESF